MQGKVCLVDGSSVVYRGFYATANTPGGLMRNRKGEPVNALITFCRTIVKTILDKHYSHMLIAFDLPQKTFRHEKFPEYKGNRPPTPTDLIAQLNPIKQMVDLMTIARHEEAGVEADDIIASAAKMLANQNYKVTILSSDRDLLQLISPNISIDMPRGGKVENLQINSENFMEIFGCRPDQIGDFKALMGDSSDNLPGVKGIGPKTALKLLNEYNDIDNIYANISAIDNAVASKLVAEQDKVKLFREIVTLKGENKLPFSPDNLIIKRLINAKLVTFLREHELFALADKFTQLLAKPQGSKFPHIVI